MFTFISQKIKNPFVLPLALIGIGAIGSIPLSIQIYKDSFTDNPQPGPPPALY